MLSTTMLTACSNIPPAAFDASSDAAELVEGPPIQNIETDFDRALSCFQGAIDPSVTFGVGQVIDSTGKETYSEGGTGKFVSQGAGEVVQSALFRAGVTVVNRRDPNIVLSENNWGVRSVDSFIPSTFYVSGSINSLDFIPGGGASLQVNGVGPRFRQNRILIGLDLALTDSHSGIVVANVALQKQVFAREVGFSIDKFFGTDLVGAELGGMEREALHFALRQMLSLATLELLGAVSLDDRLSQCRDELKDVVEDATNADDMRVNPRLPQIVKEAVARARELEESGPPAQQTSAAPAAPPQPAVAPAPEPVPEEALQLAADATVLASRAISAAERSLAAQDPEDAQAAADEALERLRAAVVALQEGASAGLTGPEGDGAALIVEQASRVVRTALERAAQLAEEAEADPVEEQLGSEGSAPASDGPQRPESVPGTADYQRRQAE